MTSGWKNIKTVVGDSAMFADGHTGGRNYGQSHGSEDQVLHQRRREG